MSFEIINLTTLFETLPQYLKELNINQSIEAYMQLVVIKKTLESISLDYRRKEGIMEESKVEEYVSINAKKVEEQ